MVDFYDASFHVLQEDVSAGFLSTEDAEVINNILYDKYNAFDSVPLVESVNAVVPVVEALGFGAMRKTGKLKKQLRKIKETRPDEFSEDSVVKDFIDKNYNKLMNAAIILEKEPSDIKSSEIKSVITVVVALIGLIGLLGTGTGVLAGVFIITYIGVCVNALITFCRVNNDLNGFKDLDKISKSLKKVAKRKDISASYKVKIQRMINAIDDAKAEVPDRFIEHKESAEIDETDVNEMRLRVYEAFEEGAISEEEKYSMLNMLDLNNYE